MRCRRGYHESIDIPGQHAEALLMQNAGADVSHAVHSAIQSLLRLEQASSTVSYKP